MNRITIHDQEYEFYSWENLGQDVFDLAKQLIEADKEFDRIVALAKGGLTFARSLVDFLQLKAISSIQIEFYSNINQTHPTPVITQSLPVSVRDERILIFDDIVDSGETMKLATEYLQHHGTRSITTAALLKKPWTEFPVEFTARSSQAWVIFPNEVRETIESLVKKWQKAGDSPEVIKKQLLKIGFSEPEVALFASLG